MTWLWRICFSAVAVLPMAGYNVTGRVRLSDSQAPDVRKHHDYAGIVVWLEPLRAATPLPVAHRVAAARMEQKDKRFVPHVLAVQVGTGVAFPNDDPIFHSAFSNFNGQVFDLGLYPPGTSRTITFDRPGIVRVFCNIHPTMSAVVVVLRYPWFAVTDAAGGFTIPDVPAGDYRLHLFHERATDQLLRSLEHNVTVSSDASLPPITISETGYIEVPHKNKYGHEYPPVPDDHGTYSAGRK